MLNRAPDFGVVKWQGRGRRPAYGVVLIVVFAIALALGVLMLAGAQGLGLAWLSPVTLIALLLIAPGLLMVTAPLARGLLTWFSS